MGEIHSSGFDLGFSSIPGVAVGAFCIQALGSTRSNYLKLGPVLPTTRVCVFRLGVLSGGLVAKGRLQRDDTARAGATLKLGSFHISRGSGFNEVDVILRCPPRERALAPLCIFPPKPGRRWLLFSWPISAKDSNSQGRRSGRSGAVVASCFV